MVKRPPSMKAPPNTGWLDELVDTSPLALTKLSGPLEVVLYEYSPTSSFEVLRWFFSWRLCRIFVVVCNLHGWSSTQCNFRVSFFQCRSYVWSFMHLVFVVEVSRRNLRLHLTQKSNLQVYVGKKRCLVVVKTSIAAFHGHRANVKVWILQNHDFSKVKTSI